MKFRREKNPQVMDPVRARCEGLSEDDLALLRKIFRDARRPLLRAGNLGEARKIAKLEFEIRYGLLPVDWDATPLARRIAARDRKAADA